jgi:hypothetical protein
MVYLMKAADGSLNVAHDRHVLGLFPRQTWMHLLSGHGLEAQMIPFEHSEIEPGTAEIYLALKR